MYSLGESNVIKRVRTFSITQLLCVMMPYDSRLSRRQCVSTVDSINTLVKDLQNKASLLTRFIESLTLRFKLTWIKADT